MGAKSSPRRRYRVFGFTASSMLELPLAPTVGTAAIDIVLGSVERRGAVVLKDDRPPAFLCLRDGEGVVLEWPEARFRVSSSRVVVDTSDVEGATDLLIPSVWSVMLSLHGRASFHGSAVEARGRALAVLGQSGSGKSTAAMALMDRGWRVVTDDLITFDAHGRVVPGPPFVRLCRDRAGGRAGRVDTAGKRRVPGEGTSPEPVPLKAIVVLDERHTSIERLSGAAAAAALLAHIYNPLRIEPEQSRRAFALAIEIAGRVPIFGAPPRSLTAGRLEQLAAEGMV